MSSEMDEEGKESNRYRFEDLQRDASKKISNGWGAASFNHDTIVFGQWDETACSPKKLIIDSDLSVKVYINEVETKLLGIRDVRSLEDIRYNIALLDAIQLCPGIDSTTRSEECLRHFEAKSRSERCIPCRLLRRRIIDRDAVRKKRALSGGVIKKPDRVRPLKEKIKRLITQVTKSKECAMELKKNCASMKKHVLEEKISLLPQEQQQAVQACFEAARVKNPRGRRYELRWIYECILMRIKSKSLYEHILSRKILAVPTLQTLEKYISKMHSSYGFDLTVFESLKRKCSDVSEFERRGVLLLDEMKLTPTVYFDKKNLLFNGFTDLSAYTPVHQSRELGDHALVFMFQPFAGTWIQTLACFLSKGCATGKVLSHLVIECINLLHASGLHVDAVVSDGAQWNRGMWTQFGINEDNVSCDHPCEENERLWFLSDFPHLIKALRNCIVSREETWTPDGVVKKKHWKAVIDVENQGFFNLKVAYKLTPDHLDPKYFQKMNVPMAFYLFSEPVWTAMDLYGDVHDELKDCEGTKNFVKRISKLITAMMSRTPRNSLRESSDEYNAISDFMQYLRQWEVGAHRNRMPFLSRSTCVGLKVTLQATLEIFHSLRSKFNVQYLMTSRLNQDSLERFFGLVREACGSNDHPDSRIFAQVFRLLSVYSLIKPRKGSNVEGVDILNSMLNIRDVQKETQKETLSEILDRIISNDDPAVELIPTFLDRVKEHDQRLCKSPDFIQGYVAGFVACRSTNLTSCIQCIRNVQSERKPGDHERYKMIDVCNRGRLQYPSDDLYKLTDHVENVILHILAGGQLNRDTFMHILDGLDDCEIPKVGCSEHRQTFTKSILSFYLITRSHFIAKRYNSINDACRKKTQKCRKDAKL